ncbi:hypothetical protein N7520_002145 [Penicillium odoratum]|uniref:uncharacterized protein n=1 Tax=Penicillium odoratum TaxID=1167516 RepID=UPI002548DFC9|nr:uncharacterized protein N7520_002145 [Penicillium odoratum]KAJ5771616.1 hypothetical protein N7520_002145 [Penicillium odoratum]
MTRVATMTITRTQNDTISVPVLTYTDALPRNDLRDITHGQMNHGKQRDLPRPGMADGHFKQPASAKFDFQLTAPPDEVTPTSARSNRSPIGLHSIGVALGSPGLVDSQELPPPRFNTAMFDQASPRKSKWKKIGGLFRAKNALTSPTATQSIPHQEGPKDKPITRTQRREDDTEEWPRIDEPKVGIDTSPNRSRKLSVSGRKNSKDKDVTPMLDVNIPDVQMERYSVMFSKVMTKNHKPSLLARRSKTLDNLRVPSAQDFLTTKLPPVPQRRATSPSHSRSSFTIFPAQPKAQKVGTQNFSRGPSPLLRSNTLPVSPKGSPDLRPNNNSTFQSPPNLFSERSNTPSLTNSYRKEDKPLPARPEPVARSRTAPVPIPQPKRSQSDRNIKAHVQGERSVTDPPRSKPNLRLQTELKGPPTPAKDKTPKSALSAKTPREQISHILFPNLVQSPMEIRSSPAKVKPVVTEREITPVPAKDITSKSALSAKTSREQISHILSPNLVLSPMEIRSSPAKFKPVVTEREVTPVSKSKGPKIEVSTARSISVSKGKRQILIPIGARVDQLNPNERLVERRAMTPTIMDVQYGHRHGISQELQIESM